MEGKPGITFNQLAKVAEHFGRGVLFFLESEPVQPERIHTPAFRTLANQKPELSIKVKSLIERVEKQRTVYLALRDELENPDLTEFSPPDLPQNAPQAAADIARVWLGLNDVNDFETYRSAVEAQGILVFRSNGYNGKWQIAKESPILGFTLYAEDCPVIVIKKQQSEARQSFTLMHELGHLLLHRISSIDDENDMHSRLGYEREANEFAGLMLVPDTFLQKIDDTARPRHVDQYDDWLKGCRRDWGVSTEVILRRLLDSGRLSQQQYAAYRRWHAGLQVPQLDGGSRAYRSREPIHIFGDTFVRAVLGALSRRRITLSKASNYLDGLKINDLHQLEKHYAGL
ncbi:ImmA/IrrE family metallo-endopeptidase [Glaciimonas immobilis]|uniref:Zn-dependent peptidase ImmA (M78 family) n=1 Tax=Glaciimonas immobilis TaxID=728004 RepID=A0A840RTC0_9BURK|nr:ImmA/IrrE family metallo-endopeptidase [Glaciimonas immobilis]MBB5199841.1 Zn-dependent peptidase ImmA (M78 family) [Glaciimonas immobilis]